jgi:hypothetical protein
MTEQAPVTVESKRPLLFRVLGLKRREGRRFLPIGFTRWGWVLSITLVAIVGSIAFAEYSMQPDFCRSCHIMEPYYQAWHTSTHKNVPCTDCHFEPGIEKTLYGKWQAARSRTRRFATPPACAADVTRNACSKER